LEDSVTVKDDSLSENNPSSMVDVLKTIIFPIELFGLF